LLAKVVRFFLTIMGFALGYSVVTQLQFIPTVGGLPYTHIINYSAALGALLTALICFLIAPKVAVSMEQFGVVLERWSARIPGQDMLAGVLGLFVGLAIGTLIAHPFRVIPVIGEFFPIISNLLLAWAGILVAVKKREELFSVFTKSAPREKSASSLDGSKPKILDTSVIIDGRIADICHAGFVDGRLIIPSFVLEELRHIADSSDTLKRNRGRRGLDILNRIQKELKIPVQVLEENSDEGMEVDSRLVKMAQRISGKVVTNDYNLNKVCELQGVPVLNINELANAVKPVVLPGEEMDVHIIKDGKELGQGIAYLDDGTMIVVDGGRPYIGDHIGVLVTSVLQTAAGRMIFAKLKHEKTG